MSRAGASYLEEAVEVVRSGGVVAVATDTLVGLLALATSAESVARVVAIKGPERQSPIPVLVPHLDVVLDLVEDFPAEARARAAAEWPGAVTIVLSARSGLPQALTAGLPTVGLRLPGPSPALDLVRAVSAPLTGTSANRTGSPAVAATADLDPEVAAAVDLVWPSESPLGTPSEVVDFTGEAPRVIRPGPDREPPR